MLVWLLLLLLLWSRDASAFSLQASSSSSSSSNGNGHHDNKPYAVNVRVAVKPSRRQEFLDLIRDNQVRTLEDEAESLQYVVGEDAATPNLFYLHEQFSSRAGFEEHRNTPHSANWAAFQETDPFDEETSPLCLDFYHVENAPFIKKKKNNNNNNPTEKKTTTPILPSKTYCVQVELFIQPSVRQEFLKCIDNNQRGSNQEPLCYQYVYGESTAEPNKFVFHEEYQGREGFEAHTRTEHFQVWEEFAATEPFTKDPVVNFFETL
jgi:quinol monooxygenase YgiN